MSSYSHKPSTTKHKISNNSNGKCGEITFCIQVGKRVYALNCIYCSQICLQWDMFINHMEQVHDKELSSEYSLQPENEVPDIQMDYYRAEYDEAAEEQHKILEPTYTELVVSEPSHVANDPLEEENDSINTAAIKVETTDYSATSALHDNGSETINSDMNNTENDEDEFFTSDTPSVSRLCNVQMYDDHEVNDNDADDDVSNNVDTFSISNQKYEASSNMYINIRELLNCFKGKNVLAFYETNNCLNNSNRRILCDLIIDKIFEQGFIGCKDMPKISKKIVEVFRTEDEVNKSLNKKEKILKIKKEIKIKTENNHQDNSRVNDQSFLNSSNEMEPIYETIKTEEVEIDQSEIVPELIKRRDEHDSLNDFSADETDSRIYDNEILFSGMMQEQTEQSSSNYRRNNIKNLRNRGLGYIGTTGKYVLDRQCQPLGDCRRKCKDKLCYENQLSLFNTYWALGAYKKRVLFMASLIGVQEKATNTANIRNRQHVVLYYIDLMGVTIQVNKSLYKKEKILKIKKEIKIKTENNHRDNSKVNDQSFSNSSNEMEPIYGTIKTEEIEIVPELIERRDEHDSLNDFSADETDSRMYDNEILFSGMMLEQTEQSSSNYRRNNIKNLRNRGLGYIGTTGKYVLDRQCQPLGDCRRKCKDKLCYENQLSLFNTYWALGAYKKRVLFMASLIGVKEKATNTSNIRNRQHVVLYYIDLMGVTIQLYLPDSEENGDEDDLSQTSSSSTNDSDEDDYNEKQFYDKQEFTELIIKYYKEHTVLWQNNGIDNKKSNKCNVAYKNITKKINKEMNGKFKPAQIKGKIYKLHSIFRKEQQLINELEEDKIKDKSNENLNNEDKYGDDDGQPTELGEIQPTSWLYTKLIFLKDHLNYNRKRSKRGTKALNNDKSYLPIVKLSPQENLQLIEYYQSYPCLWDVNHIGYRFKNQRYESLQELLELVNIQMDLNLSLSELQKKLYYIRYAYTQEKHRQIECERLRREFKPQCKLYAELLFLKDSVGPFKCEYCDDIFNGPDQYKIHKSTHDGSMPYTCPICKKGFKKVGNCTVHLRRHTKDYQFECKECGKKFATSTDLNVHGRHHTGEKPYFCDICGQSFRTWTYFDSHRRRHEKKPHHKCSICSKGFYENNKLRQHMKSHLNVRDKICNACGKSFTCTKYLNQHKQTHAKVKKYSCKICGKNFAQYGGLSSHMKLHGTVMNVTTVHEEIIDSDDDDIMMENILESE